MALIDYTGTTARRRGTVAQTATPTTGTTAAAPDPAGPQFTDPSINRIETQAINQYNAETNPAADSPSANYERYLSQLATTLQQPAYSQSDEAIYKGGALDAIQREQDATEQRYLQELSRRGIDPKSGIGQDGVLKIRNHYAGLRTTEHGNFARKAIDDTRQQRFQVADVMGQQVNAGRQRQEVAQQWARIPYQLTQDAFARNSAVAGGNSPASYLDSQINVADGNARTTQSNQRAQGDSIAALMEYLSYMGVI